MRIQNVTLIANGDLRLAANQKAWPMQQRVEQLITAALQDRGVVVTRGHSFDETLEHGLIDSQKQGMSVFRDIDSQSPLVVVLSTWQYSHHILAGLMTHEGPILTVANFSGTWPGLVGLLNLNASLTKAGKEYSTLWSETFDDSFFREQLDVWIDGGTIVHDESHVTSLPDQYRQSSAFALGRDLGKRLQSEKAIIGVFDEGCMGMYNAIVPDHLLNPTGLYKERLSQSALYYATSEVDDSEAEACLDWLEARGLTFDFGDDDKTDLTRAQVLTQLKMYIAVVRIADKFGCSAVGIQYQQGLKDLLPASDLAEGLLNNVDRPPVFDADGGRELFAGRALPHFNEVDECAAIDALVTNIAWTELGIDPENTLHDVRWGDMFDDNFVWVFEISGAAPPAHFIDGFQGASSMRQPPMYFRLGGGTLRGISKPGRIVWSRIYVEDNELRADLGLGSVIELPEEETERRWRATNYEWPIMHAVLDGVS
ncbi:MAG: fucose isomerase, partial [Rhodothermales bacterium]|nr:fucose isomerase [Rhodothermales bacterium]